MSSLSNFHIGTRCPLDTTCIHDANCREPRCELSGKELDEACAGTGLTTADVFAAITRHNQQLGEQERFSMEPLHLVYRANNVQNMRFVDTPGIISNLGTGKDNREDIKSILRNTMKRPNSKLYVVGFSFILLCTLYYSYSCVLFRCVLVEPKEFSTNAILDFCDVTFGSKDWSKDAIV